MCYPPTILPRLPPSVPTHSCNPCDTIKNPSHTIIRVKSNINQIKCIYKELIIIHNLVVRRKQKIVTLASAITTLFTLKNYNYNLNMPLHMLPYFEPDI